MSTQSWHADERLLRRYADGDADAGLQASVEMHVATCHRCRAAAADHVEPARLAKGFAGVLAEVDAPLPGVIERALRRAGVAHATARLLAATPSLRLSWLLALSGTLVFAVAAAHVGEDPRTGPLLLASLAPLLPLAGVAAAYGPRVDPAFDISVAAPISGWRLLLLRAMAVLMSTTALAGVAGLALPEPDLSVVAWLLPSLALTLCSLALSTLVSPLRAAGIVAAVWVAVVASAIAGEAVAVLLGAGLQTIAALGAVLGAAVLTARRRSFETRTPR